MARGLLPPHYLSKAPDEDLRSYVDTYLSEEIAAEGQARNLPAFARFLQTAADAQRKDDQLHQRCKRRPSAPSDRAPLVSDTHRHHAGLRTSTVYDYRKTQGD